jgi:acetyl-CoA carboxylase biotin carboxyl carrier protein
VNEVKAMDIELVSEMTAVVLSLECAEGDLVAAGDEVMVLESMKMEIPVIATSNGTLTRFLVAEGQTVDARDVLAIISTGV